MARFDKVPEGGKFRAEAASGLDGTAGAWGDGDLLCVDLDSSGQLVAGTSTGVFGVISTSEGRRDNHYVAAADQKKVVGGYRYTVMRIGEILDAATFSTQAYAAGDNLYAAASGGVATDGPAGTGDVYLGTIVPREEDSTQLRVVVNLRGQAAAT